MSSMTRREFTAVALALGAATEKLSAANHLDDTLHSSVRTRNIPAVAAMLATPDRIIWSAAFGSRDSDSNIPVRPDSIFAIASMTKPVTTTAALQLWSAEPLPSTSLPQNIFPS